MYNDQKVKSLHIMLPKTRGCVKSYDGHTKWMYFLIEDDSLLGQCNTIWGKVWANIKKEFDKVDSNHTCLISLDSPLKKSYQQRFLKECKYIEKKIIRQINDNFRDFFSSDEPDQE